MNIGHPQHRRANRVHSKIREDRPVRRIHLRQNRIVRMSQHEIACQMIGVIKDRRYVDEKKRDGENNHKRHRSYKPKPAVVAVGGQSIANDQGGV